MTENDWTPVQVRYTGVRVWPMRVRVVVDGDTITPSGFVFGADSVQNMTLAEANALTGATPPVLDEDGRIKTGFWVEGDLGEAGLVGEKYEIVAAAAAESTAPIAEPAVSPANSEAETPTQA